MTKYILVNSNITIIDIVEVGLLYLISRPVSTFLFIKIIIQR